MRTATEKFTIGLSKQGSGEVESKTGNSLAVTESGENVWFPKVHKQKEDITYRVHEKGDTFVATSDSTTTKGEALDKDELAAIAKKANKPVETVAKEPLFLMGETVTRRGNSTEFVGFSGKPVLTEDDEMRILGRKAEILAKAGIKSVQL